MKKVVSKIELFSKYLPSLADLVEDNMLNRWLFPLCTLLLFILLVIQLTTPEEIVNFGKLLFSDR